MEIEKIIPYILAISIFLTCVMIFGILLGDVLGTIFYGFVRILTLMAMGYWFFRKFKIERKNIHAITISYVISELFFTVAVFGLLFGIESASEIAYTIFSDVGTLAAGIIGTWVFIFIGRFIAIFVDKK